jgi:SAM-dependent methyltransferase
MKIKETMRTGALHGDYARLRREVPYQIYRYKVRARVVVRAIEEHLRVARPFRLLDFGSADGLSLVEMRSLLPLGTYVGVEYSEELLRHASDLPAEIRVLAGDVRELPEAARAEPYDVVSALAVLEHLPDPSRAVREAASVLRPGGLFVATCPQPTWDAVATSLGLLPGDPDEYHLTQLDRRGMIDLVEGAGMSVLAFERFMCAPIGFLPYLKISVPPALSLSIDRLIGRARVFDWLFVNQLIVARHSP